MADEYNILDEEYEDLLDEAQDEMDDSADLREDQLGSFAETYPEGRTKEDLYSWFWKVVKLKKPFQLVKVGNLNSKEIGPHSISTRDAMNLWILGHQFNHPTFGDYFAQQAKILSASSMAKSGWFMDLSISQKRVRARAKKSRSPSDEKSWRIFKKKKGIED